MLTLLRLLLLTSALIVPAATFTAELPNCLTIPGHNSIKQQRITVSNVEAGESSLAMAPSSKRYGPVDDRMPPTSNDVNERNRLKSNFTQLLNTIIDGNTPEHEYPSLFTQNIDTIMKVIGYSNNDNKRGRSLLDEIMQEAAVQSNNDESTIIPATTTAATNRVDQISDAINLILTFVESFVEETKSMDDVYKKLLGKIFQSIAPSASPSNNRASSTAGVSSIPTSSSTSVANMELQLDNLLSTEKAAFTPGFLRHVEGECIRISSLSTISPESVTMLQILRLIQTRVLEELGKVSFFVKRQRERAVDKENG